MQAINKCAFYLQMGLALFKHEYRGGPFIYLVFGYHALKGESAIQCGSTNVRWSACESEVSFYRINFLLSLG